MDDLASQPYNHARQWLPSLGMAVAVHLFFFLAGMYTPGFFNFRRDEAEISTVRLVDVAEVEKQEPKQSQDVRPSQPLVLRKNHRIAKLSASPLSANSKPPATASRAKDSPPVAPAALVSLQPVISSGSMDIGVKKSGDILEQPRGLVSSGFGKGVAESASLVSAGGEGAASPRKLYLARLMAHIEAHKFYPLFARRQRLEGGVQVQFTLKEDGGVSNLRVSNGVPILEQAAREAVEKALPLPLPKENGIVPLAVSYQMKFQLR